MKLIFSPDEHIWYWQRWDWKKSQPFSTRTDAIRAYRRGLCTWED